MIAAPLHIAIDQQEIDMSNNMYQASLKSNKADAESRAKNIQRSLDALEDPNSWYGRQHQALLAGYMAVSAIWANMPDDFEQLSPPVK